VRIDVAVIGAGPAGLMAAERLSAGGRAVTIFERMPSLGRKLLMAGRGGLNLTHSDALPQFLTRYGGAQARLRPMLEAFPPSAAIAWAEGLGQPTFVGSSGRIFPKAMKASPLLRAWLARLAGAGVQFHTRHLWTGWDESGRLLFRRADGTVARIAADTTILVLGGASWPRLGTDGRWVSILERAGIPVTPLAPANCGVVIPWSAPFRERFQGTPLKRISLSVAGQSVKGEAVVTASGLEGGAVYALTRALRMAGFPAALTIDLKPDLSAAQIEAKLGATRAGESFANRLRKALNLAPAQINLLREAGVEIPREDAALVQRIKALPLKVTGLQDLACAISTAGGVPFEALNESLMLKAKPGVYVAGEMLDWEAPTGGYLLQACLATGAAVADAILTSR
jgi:uncharacterized flavoprotein (TIGR03862 family)